MKKLYILLLLSGSFGGLSAQALEQAGQHQNQAAALLIGQDLNGAVSELRKAAALYEQAESWEHYFSCLNQITEAQLGLGQLDKAKQTAKQALWQSLKELGGDNDEAAKASHKLGQVYESAGRYTDAKDCHRMAIRIREGLYPEQHPALAESLQHLARTSIAEGALEEAGQLLAEAQQILQSYYGQRHPASALPLELLAHLRLTEGDSLQAQQLYQTAIKLQRTAPEQYPLELGRNLCRLAAFKQGDKQLTLYQEASELFLSYSARREPLAATAFLALSQAAPQLKEQRRYAQLAIQASPESAAGQSAADMLAHLEYLAGRFAAAASYYEQRLAQRGYRPLPEAWQQAVQAALLSGQAERAADWAARYAAAAPPDSAAGIDARLLQAEADLALGQAEAALARLDELLGRDRLSNHQQAMAYRLKGQALSKLATYEQAISAYQTSLELAPPGSPMHWPVLALLGRAHAQLARQDRNTLDNLAAAIRHFQAFAAAAEQAASSPMLPQQQAWLRQQLNAIYEDALFCSALLKQQRQSPEALEQAYFWMESGKRLQLWLAAQQNWQNDAAQQFRQFLLEAQTQQRLGQAGPPQAAQQQAQQAWAKAQGKAQQALRYAIKPCSLADFQALARKLDLKALHYWVGEQDLFVLSISASQLQLQRKQLRPDVQPALAQHLLSARSATAMPDALQVQQWLLPHFRPSADPLPRLAVFPHGLLSGFPFAALPWGEGFLGTQSAIYWHACASTFNQDYLHQSSLPAVTAPRVALLSGGGEQPLTSSTAVPAAQYRAPNCLAWLSQWVLETGQPHHLSLSAPLEASLALVDGQAADSLFRKYPLPELQARHLMLLQLAPASDAAAWAARPAQLQQAYAGAITLAHWPCTSDAFVPYFAQALDKQADPALALQTARANYQQANDGRSSQAWAAYYIYGVPLPVAAEHNHFAFWILAGVLALVLVGWALKR